MAAPGLHRDHAQDDQDGFRGLVILVGSFVPARFHILFVSTGGAPKRLNQENRAAEQIRACQN